MTWKGGCAGGAVTLVWPAAEEEEVGKPVPGAESKITSPF